MAVESIFYSVSGLSCRGALVWDESAKAPRPLLLMAPNWRGVIKPEIPSTDTNAICLHRPKRLRPLKSFWYITHLF